MTLQTLARWCVCTAIVGGLALNVGCRRRDPYIDGYLEITRAEKMDLEDQIYALEDQLAQRDREIEALRARLPGGTSRGTRKESSPSSAPPTLDDSELLPPAIEPGVPIEPQIELPPVEATPKTKTSRNTPTPARRPEVALVEHTELAPPDEQAAATEESSEPSPAQSHSVAQASFRPPQAPVELEDTLVTNLFINPFYTKGVELDQQPGDDGITLLFEPRNAAGQYVPQAGEVTVVLLDPAISGESARVARWELSKTEVGKRIIDTRPERGIKVQLKWPEERPQHGKLKLFVRYTNTNGELIETRSDVFITLPGELSQRWTPRRE
jgi:hypothetical protein